MHRLRSIIPAEIRSILIRIAGALCFLTASRIIFFLSNTDSFSNVNALCWLTGIWFDFVTLCLFLLPYSLFAALPIKLNQKRWYSAFTATLFVLPVAFILVFNFIDTQYFHFTQKRSTADFFAFVGTGNDVNQLIATFFKEFWRLVVLFLILFALLIFFVRQTTVRKFHSQPIGKLKSVIFYVVFIVLQIIGGRGGFSVKPLNIIDATLYTEPQNSALVLNSGFTILKTLGQSDLTEKHYFPDQLLPILVQTKHRTQPQQLFQEQPNVMVIILEGIGQEFIGTYTDSTSYTPFLDSLIPFCWHFKYGMANGKKSIEGIPAITAGIPTLMDNPFIQSAYATNRINTLPSVLKKHGYSSAFYHGATNGSMRFNSFAKQAGFDKYVGRTEYNNEQHADVTWGILDEYFEPWTARQLTKLKAPFCGVLFTLSSHHPWYVPKKWRNVLPKGKQPMCQSIAYGDLSLKLFFEEAKKQPWYNNTLFVIVADHSNPTGSIIWSQRHNMYKIPILFYHPSGKLPAKEEQQVFQQTDIMPTIFDLLNIEDTYYSLGNSWYTPAPHESVAYLEGTYYYFQDGRMLAFANDRSVQFVDFTGIELTPKKYPLADPRAKKMEKRLKALIQTYNRDLIHNEMSER